MLSENIKILRRQKGMSQEVLAQQLHVVRQTVSKWEKGLSVPDAEMLARIGELLEVPVSDLLGETVEPQKDINEVAVQLALLNEQLAGRRRRTKKVLICLAAGLLICAVALGTALFFLRAENHSPKGKLTTTTLTCTLGEETYVYDLTYDEQYRIFYSGGDAWIAEHVMTEKYNNAREMIAQIEDYFTDRGGAVEIENGPYEEN